MKHIQTAAVRSLSRAVITRTAAMVAAVALLTACPKSGDKSVTEPNNGPEGSYELRQVDAKGLPARIHQGPWLDRVNTRFYNKLIMDVVGGAMVMEEDGSYSLDFQFEYNADGQPGTTTWNRHGSYTIDGEDVTFRWGSNPPGTFLGTIRNGVVTIPYDFMSKGVNNDFAFRR